MPMALSLFFFERDSLVAAQVIIRYDDEVDSQSIIRPESTSDEKLPKTIE